MERSHARVTPMAAAIAHAHDVTHTGAAVACDVTHIGAAIARVTHMGRSSCTCDTPGRGHSM